MRDKDYVKGDYVINLSHMLRDKIQAFREDSMPELRGLPDQEIFELVIEEMSDALYYISFKEVKND